MKSLQQIVYSTFLLATILAALFAQPVQSHKLLILNDIHLDIDSTQYYATPGKECNYRTLDLVLSEAAKLENDSSGPIEAILLVGDLNKHGLATKDFTLPIEDTDWETMKTTMIEVITAIKTNFPNVPILPVIGNNDVVYHDQAPTSDIKQKYYEELWDIMFKNVTANAEIAANTTIEATWMAGGYYVYELGDDTMILNLNGMYPFYENIEEPQIAEEMILWVDEVLTKNTDKNWITQTHVFFGNNYFDSLEILWNETYTNQLVQVMQPHQDRHVISIGAHIHHVQIMAPESAVQSDLNIVQVISPAISPIYNNNPGYGMLKFEDEKVKSLVFRFFQIEDYSRLGLVSFNHYDVMSYTGVDLNDASSVRDYIDTLLYNMQAYAGYIARNFGLKEFFAEGSQLWWPFITDIYSSQTAQVAQVCMLKYFNTSLQPSYCQRALGLNTT